MPLTIPHFELLVPEDSLSQYRGKFPEPTPYVDSRRHYADQPEPRAVLAAMISRMDRDIGRLFESLNELGIDDNTIVFFTSDNGGYQLAEEFFHGNGHLRGGKGSFYEGGLRVPMIVRWPGKIRAGATDDYVWSEMVAGGGAAKPPVHETPSSVDPEGGRKRATTCGVDVIEPLRIRACASRGFIAANVDSQEPVACDIDSNRRETTFEKFCPANMLRES